MVVSGFPVLPVQSGEGEIRTHDALSDIAVFKTAALSRSATSPLCAGLFFEAPPFAGHVRIVRVQPRVYNSLRPAVCGAQENLSLDYSVRFSSVGPPGDQTSLVAIQQLAP